MRKGEMQNCPNTAISFNKLGLFEDIGKQLRNNLANTETSIHLPYLRRGEACLEVMAKATFHCFYELWVECQRLHGQESLASSKQLLRQYTHSQHRSGLWPVMFADCGVQLWRTRNDTVFNRIQTPTVVIKVRICDNLRLWNCPSRKDSRPLWLF
uniref:Uncharacterized protein n=1 Tax=Triticum urartu TaxID=4572 RepID=A0A8R7TMU9_TRIUA